MKAKAIYLFRFVSQFLKDLLRARVRGYQPIYFEYEVVTSGTLPTNSSLVRTLRAVNVANVCRKTQITQSVLSEFLDDRRLQIEREINWQLRDAHHFKSEALAFKRISAQRFFWFCCKNFGTHENKTTDRVLA